jgi:hypothetical protein
MKTEAEVRAFLAQKPGASDAELGAFLKSGRANMAPAPAAPQKKLGQNVAPRDRSAEGSLRRQEIGGGVGLKEGLLTPRAVKNMDTGALSTFMQGASLNTSDELLGGLAGIIDKDMTLGEGIAADRESVSRFREENPGGALGLNILGSATAPAALTALKAPAVATLGRTLKEGAALGAAMEAGATEGGVKKRLGASVKGAAIGAPVAAGGYGVVKAATNALRPAVSRASGELLDMYGSAKTSLKAISERMRGSKPTTLADEMGQTGLRKLRAARAVSPVAGEQIDNAFTTRRGGQEERILTDLLETSGIGGRTNTVKTAKSIIAERAENSKPLYEAAYSVDVKDPRILKVMKHPEFQDAYARAQRIARLEENPLPDLDPDKGIPVRAFDYLKRVVDDISMGKVDSGASMTRTEGRALRTRLNEMLGHVDELVPEFAEARAYYKGESDLLEALETGRTLWRMHPDEAAEILRNPALSDGERELMRKGFMESIADKVESVAQRADATKRRPLEDVTLDRKRLRLLFDDDESFEAFKTRLAEEVKLARGEDYVRGGSNTADKLSDIAEMAGAPIGEVLQLATGNVRPLIERAASSKLGSWSQGMTRKKAESLTPMLLAQTPEELIQVGKNLTREEVRQKNVRQLGSGIGRALVLGTGARQRER